MNFFSAGVMSNRHGEPQVLTLAGEIKLPAYPCNRVSLAHEKAVAEFAIAAIHKRKNPTPATVGDFKQHSLVALGHIFRLEQIKIGREFHFTMRVARSFIQVHNLPVVQVRRVDGEIDAPDELFIGAGVSKWLAVL